MTMQEEFTDFAVFSQSGRADGHVGSLSASVVICVYNRPRQVIACLESLLKQDHRPLEIIVVDDGSTDETPRVLVRFQQEHQKDDIPLRILTNPCNLGLCAARNVGLDAATGDVVLYTDSDCTTDPHWVSAMVRALHDGHYAAAAGRVIDAVPTNWAERAAAGNTRIGVNKLQARPLVGNNMAIRQSLLAAYRFDEHIKCYADEDDLARRMAGDGHRFAFVDAAIVYHHHPMNLRSYLRQAWRQGQGSAYFWWKHRILIGRDLLFLFLAIGSLPLLLRWPALWPVPAGLFSLHMLAHLFNERAFKGKSWGTAIAVLPLVLLHSVVKAASVTQAYGRFITSGISRRGPKAAPHVP